MPPEIQDNLGLILIVAALAYAAWKYKQGKKVAPAAQQGAVAPVYIQAPAPAPAQPKATFFDLFVEDKRQRDAEIERAALRGTLDKIAGIVGPESPPK